MYRLFALPPSVSNASAPGLLGGWANGLIAFVGVDFAFPRHRLYVFVCVCACQRKTMASSTACRCKGMFTATCHKLPSKAIDSQRNALSEASAGTWQTTPFLSVFLSIYPRFLTYQEHPRTTSLYDCIALFTYTHTHARAYPHACIRTRIGIDAESYTYFPTCRQKSEHRSLSLANEMASRQKAKYLRIERV